MSLKTEKIVFWAVWVLAAPFVFVFFVAMEFYRALKELRWPDLYMPWVKTGGVCQSVYEKKVLRKGEVMNDYRQRPNNPSPRFQKNRKLIANQIKKRK